MDNLLLFTPPQPSGPADAAARASALDIQRSWIVEAPAGSGKTSLLIQRFLRLLASPQVEDPSQVLACTFTRKATGELRDRVLAQLTRAHHHEPPRDDFERATRPFALAVLERDARLGWGILDRPNRLNIRTLDSVAGEIAAGAPILAGAGAASVPTENAGPLFAEAARRTVMQLGGDDPTLSAALRDLILHRDGNLANSETLIAAMLALREQWAPLLPRQPAELTDDYLDTQVLPRFERALSLIICRGLTRLLQTLPSSFLSSLCSLAAEMAFSEAHGVPLSPMAPCAGMTGPPGPTVENLDRWIAVIGLVLTKDGEYRKPRGLTNRNLKFVIEAHHSSALSDLIDRVRADQDICELLHSVRELPPAHYSLADWAIAKSIFRVLAHALIELQLVFAETTRCDFNELGILAESVLRADDTIETLGSFANLQHLLIDEMQDTSAAQYQLIQLLTRHWDGYSQTVFLVGDPKQSIYLFRQARVERFVHTMHSRFLGAGPDAIPLGVLRLTANFRSQRHLVECFNTDFCLVFPSQPDPSNPEVVPYSPAQPVRLSTPSPGRVWHPHRFPVMPSPQRVPEHRRQSQRFALEIRRIIQQWRARPLPRGRAEPWRIAVLVSNRTHLLQIIRAFNRQGPSGPVPYRTINVELLNERDEVLDLLALTRALLHPADRTAWLALLRAPWCGLTLADLHILAGQDDRSLAAVPVLELIDRRAHLLSADGHARLQPFDRTMRAALASRTELSISQSVSRTWNALGAAPFLDSAALSNVESYFAVLDELSAGSATVAVADLTSRLQVLYAAPSLQPDAVDLMTIHRAKGLEWDLVLVPSLERAGRNDSGRLLSWLEIPAETGINADQDATLGLIAPIQSRGTERGPLAKWIAGQAAQREAAERKRLFYVASTRAREELHLFAAPKTSASKTDEAGELQIPANSLLAAAWPAAEPQFPREAAATNLIQMPVPPPEPLAEVQPETLALAAAAEPAQPARIIHRIPIPPPPAIHPPTPTPLQPIQPSPLHPSPVARPGGTFAARALGNTLHAFFELIAGRIAAGHSPTQLLAELPSWPPRIAALLRAGGLAPTEVESLGPSVLLSLRQTLNDPDGQWLLAPHPLASSESALASWSADSETRTGLRLDRTFLAGPTPHAPGHTHLWIIDYKTASQGSRSRAAFLEREKQQYQQQLEAYAARLAPAGHPIRLGLYFPTLPALHWWSPTETANTYPPHPHREN